MAMYTVYTDGRPPYEPDWLRDGQCLVAIGDRVYDVRSSRMVPTFVVDRVEGDPVYTHRESDGYLYDVPMKYLRKCRED